jgi:hypothetical protein
MLTEEKLNKNYLLYIDFLKKYDCYSQSMFDEIGEDIKVASFSMNESSGSSYQGSMIDVVLRTLCVIGKHINDGAFGGEEKDKHPLLKVDNNSLMRVLLLQHISKCQIFKPSTETWKINKGMFYEFNDKLSTSLKLGERSIYLCMKYGITLNEEEYEAIRILDKDEDKNSSYITPLSALVKMANHLTSIELYQKTK